MMGKDIFYALNDIDSALLTKQPSKKAQSRKLWHFLVCVAVVLFVVNICVYCVAKFDEALWASRIKPFLTQSIESL